MSLINNFFNNKIWKLFVIIYPEESLVELRSNKNFPVNIQIGPLQKMPCSKNLKVDFYWESLQAKNLLNFRYISRLRRCISVYVNDLVYFWRGSKHEHFYQLKCVFSNKYYFKSAEQNPLMLIQNRVDFFAWSSKIYRWKILSLISIRL